MNRILALCGLLMILLAACGGKTFDRAYMASGEGLRESELSPDEQFTGTDDLIVEVKLNLQSDDENGQVVFTYPNGEVMERI
jgi:hypothetical protein